MNIEIFISVNSCCYCLLAPPFKYVQRLSMFFTHDANPVEQFMFITAKTSCSVMRILFLIQYHYGWFKIVGKVKCVIELKLQLIVIVQRYETFSLLFQLEYTWSIKYGT